MRTGYGNQENYQECTVVDLSGKSVSKGVSRGIECFKWGKY